MEFEWDEEKASRNFAKHGISFGLATQIFKRPVFTLKTEWEAGELRSTDVGIANNLIFVVVTHTDRDGRTRIISARKATPLERRIYDANCT